MQTLFTIENLKKSHSVFKIIKLNLLYNIKNFGKNFITDMHV